eukprot:Blabericola_migrator_1__4187@NODE_2282_length_3003_cov_199_534401_g1429_i1_p1_GENE_NODE_2282_length_3003_cov_199_534401_g1429_i1NODE_2282_length_3003_cov_199_534401_g1429_i1_p1_ORF_typecomplete_len343_score115_38_NODE_2282_length_3003_cov_199_534401_g1429_i116122640
MSIFDQETPSPNKSHTPVDRPHTPHTPIDESHTPEAEDNLPPTLIGTLDDEDEADMTDLFGDDDTMGDGDCVNDTGHEDGDDRQEETQGGDDSTQPDDTQPDGDDTHPDGDETQPDDTQPDDTGSLPPPKQSKLLEKLDAIYNPERWENDKSLWQFWQNELKHFPTVDEMAIEKERKGLKVDMEMLHYEWFSKLLCLYRSYLQAAFEDSLELPILGRRLQRYQETQRQITEWRYQWIRKYKEEQELDKLKRATVVEPTADERRAAALARRQAKLLTQDDEGQRDPPSKSADEDRRQNDSDPPVEEDALPTVSSEFQNLDTTQDRRAQALARRQTKLRSMGPC